MVPGHQIRHPDRIQTLRPLPLHRPLQFLWGHLICFCSFDMCSLKALSETNYGFPCVNRYRLTKLFSSCNWLTPWAELSQHSSFHCSSVWGLLVLCSNSIHDFVSSGSLLICLDVATPQWWWYNLTHFKDLPVLHKLTLYHFSPAGSEVAVATWVQVVRILWRM